MDPGSFQIYTTRWTRGLSEKLIVPALDGAYVLS